MINVQTRQSGWILALFAAFAIFFTSVPMAWAAGEIINQNGTSVNLIPSKQNGIYTLKVTGKTYTSSIRTVTATIDDTVYNVPFRSKSQTFILSKKVKFSSPLPETAKIVAVDKSGNTDSIEVAIPPNLVNEASLNAKKKTFIGKEVYFYEISGSVISNDIASLVVIIGNTEKAVEITNGVFKTTLFERDAKTVTIQAESEDGKQQSVEVKIK